MPVPLDKWQERLEKHFTALAAARSQTNFPLFALEHNLSRAEFEEMAPLLRSRLAARFSLEPHWLLWVIYASEFGYRYDGHEYWQSFELETPHWHECASGRQLRGWFSKFQRTYHGVVPSGPWAAWFKNIAGPITHAILPTYLQHHFAKALYALSHRLASLQSLNAASVGRLLARNTLEASSRFRQFLQQEELAGRIVLALLSDITIDDRSPIYGPTLERIVADLEAVRSSRLWLREARQAVADQFKGTGRASILLGARPEVVRDREPENPAPLRIQPALGLRRTGATTWSAFVDIPGFASIARINPEVAAFVRGTRCKVAGGTEAWLPGGWLLEPRKRVLKTWPDHKAPIVAFERKNGFVDHLLDTECRLTAGAIWVCKIGADGLAREIAGRIVRPGRKYVLLSRQPLALNQNHLSPCSVDCAGISSALLTVPDNVSVPDINAMHQFGLQVGRTIRIWPAGLLARNWDGEGRSEWLTTETPCFGVIHDHPVDEYVLRLDHGAEMTISAARVGHPLFVRLPQLPAGKHVLSVKARRTALASSFPSLSALEGVVELAVREPNSWVPGTTLHSGLAVSLDPPDPSLDTFWEGNVGVSIFGPDSHRVTCSITLTGANGTEILSQEMGQFDLPVSAAQWSKKLNHFARNEQRAWTYLEAASGRVAIKGEELGEYVLRLEKDLKPLRLICRNTQRKTIIRLINDTGSDAAASIKFFAFNRPFQPVLLDYAILASGFEPAIPGGLFVAKDGEHTDKLVVSTSRVAERLTDLLIDPEPGGFQTGSMEVNALLDYLALWLNARLAGPLADIRRNHIAKKILNGLYAKLCGTRWSEAEAAFLSNPHDAAALQQLEKAVGGSPGFAVVLRREAEKMRVGTGAGKNWFAGVAARYVNCSEPALCEFALRLASQPDQLRSALGAKFDELLPHMMGKSVVLRGARLLALIEATQDPGQGGTAMPRWIW